jgi:flavin reductase (DIM6/NTAB) family NADH-FMN oxidoreductase RutF
VKRLASALWHGKGLRHLPIAVGADDAPPVRLDLERAGHAPLDVSAAHVPVSMRPLVLGVRLDDARRDAPTERCTLAVRDVASGARLGEITLEPAGEMPLAAGTLSLFRTVACRNATAPARVRWWRYALAWRHAMRAPARGDGLCMSAADLRCLNVYYTWPRRVFLVGAAFEGRTNLFPMDLVGRVSPDDFTLALRATSPAIELMERSRVIAMSAAPAEHLAEVYALGVHHRKPTVDTSTLPFDVRASALHGLPVLAQGFTRELTVRAVHRVGSHVLFVCRVDPERGRTTRQIAHVSQMYAEWLAKRGRALDRLG